jgi:hypothetical protein
VLHATFAVIDERPRHGVRPLSENSKTDKPPTQRFRAAREVFHVMGLAQRISATPVREVLISEALKASARVDLGSDDEDAP